MQNGYCVSPVLASMQRESQQPLAGFRVYENVICLEARTLSLFTPGCLAHLWRRLRPLLTLGVGAGKPWLLSLPQLSASLCCPTRAHHFLRKSIWGCRCSSVTREPAWHRMEPCVPFPGTHKPGRWCKCMLSTQPTALTLLIHRGTWS